LLLFKAGVDCPPCWANLLQEVEKSPVVLRVLQMAQLMGNDVFDANRRGADQVGIEINPT
jgi:hypothetical protein